MLQVSLEGGAVYQDIVKEDDNKLSEIRLEEHVHGSLEQRGSIAEPKRHHLKLILI